MSLRCSWSVLVYVAQNQGLNVSTPLGKNFPLVFHGLVEIPPIGRGISQTRVSILWVMRIAVMFRFLLVAFITMVSVSWRVDKSIIGLSSFLLHRSAKNRQINQLVERHPWRCMEGRRCEQKGMHLDRDLFIIAPSGLCGPIKIGKCVREWNAR